MATTTVERVEDRSRYELVEDGTVVGFADYHEQGEGVLVLPHTVIDPLRRGSGLGDVLVGGLLADVRARGQRVVPACWFVADYVQRHPDAGDLLA